MGIVDRQLWVRVRCKKTTSSSLKSNLVWHVLCGRLWSVMSYVICLKTMILRVTWPNKKQQSLQWSKWAKNLSMYSTKDPSLLLWWNRKISHLIRSRIFHRLSISARPTKHDIKLSKRSLKSSGRTLSRKAGPTLLFCRKLRMYTSTCWIKQSFSASSLPPSFSNSRFSGFSTQTRSSRVSFLSLCTKTL